MVDTSGKGWNPYLAGALTGLLMVSSVWLTGKFFGASTSFVRSAGMIERVFPANPHSGAERIGHRAENVNAFAALVGVGNGLQAGCARRHHELKFSVGDLLCDGVHRGHVVLCVESRDGDRLSVDIPGSCQAVYYSRDVFVE